MRVWKGLGWSISAMIQARAYVVCRGHVGCVVDTICNGLISEGMIVDNNYHCV